MIVVVLLSFLLKKSLKGQKFLANQTKLTLDITVV